MKKKYMILAGLLTVTMLASGCGCGKKKTEEKPKETPVTVAPTKAAEENVVNMQPIKKEDEIKNVMGTKTADASSVILINKTGSEVSEIYIRPNDDDSEEWGEELIKGAFSLKNNEKAIYYYDKNAKGEDGRTISLYDIRIEYSDEDRNECYFRKLPIKNMTEITLRMDGSGEDSLPFATFKTATSTKEYSTLNEVKKRVGILEDEDDSDYEDYEDSDNSSESESDENYETEGGSEETPEPTETPDNPNSGDGGYDDDPVVEEDPQAAQAEQYIGQSIEALTDVMGMPPGGNSYEEQPEIGEIGYHYFDSFTVSTIVGEDGSEIVSGIY